MKVRVALTMMVLVVFSALALMAAAADVSGTWNGSIMDPSGNKFDVTCKLIASGNSLTGSVAGGPPRGDEAQISDGKIEGDQLSWETHATGMGPNKSSVTYKYKVKVNGNQMQGSVSGPGRDGEVEFSISAKKQ